MNSTLCFIKYSNKEGCILNKQYKTKGGTSHTSAQNDFLKNIGIGCLAEILLCVLFLSLSALIITKVDIPFDLHQPIATAAAALSALSSAFVCGKMQQKNGLLSGITISAVGFVVLFLTASIFGSENVSVQALIKLIAMMSAGGIGGITGVSSAIKQKKSQLKISV